MTLRRFENELPPVGTPDAPSDPHHARLSPIEKARRAWNDPEVTSLRESHVNPAVDEQVVAWAWTWGHLP